MTSLLRMISPSYRRAVAAEAGGNYLEAARFYALCGMREKVAEMHLLQAEHGDGQESKLRELRAAVHFADEKSEQGRVLLQRIGKAFVAALRKGVISDRDRTLCREAAQLSLRAGDPLTAAEAFELMGDELQAAEAYKEAGDLERMEAILAREERRRKGQAEERDSFDVYETSYLLGQRDKALDALRACVNAAPRKDEPRRLLEELGARLLQQGRVVLRQQDGQTTIYVGTFPLFIGRGAECQLPLRDAGISRCHAGVSIGPALPGAIPAFALRDVQSKNGTTLNGLAIAGKLVLREEGEIGIGEHCTLGYRVSGAQLHLRITRGMDRGLKLCASPLPIQLLPDIELRFEQGRPYLCGPSSVLLNGQHAQRSVQLIQGDVAEIGGARYEVLS